jgi:hypothetical protein
MAMRQKFLGIPKPIAGAALATLGVFLIYENLDAAATQLKHALGIPTAETLGPLPTMLLAAARVMHAYASSHQHFLQGVAQHLLVSCWPLLLVVVGTACFQHTRTAEVAPCPRQEYFQKKAAARVDFTTHRSTCN